MNLRVLVLIPVLLSWVSGLQAQAPNATACSSSEYRQFDFWEGSWVVKDPSGKELGRNRIDAILGGCVLQENWEGGQGSSGHSFNMFEKTSGVWHQTWVDNSGSRLDLRGGLEGEGQAKRMILAGEGRTAAGKPVEHRITWTPKADGTVEQHWQTSLDDGASWQDAFLGIYHPLP